MIINKNTAMFFVKLAGISSNYKFKSSLSYKVSEYSKGLIAEMQKSKNSFQKLFPFIKSTLLNKTHRHNLIELGKVAIHTEQRSQIQEALLIDRFTTFSSEIIKDKELIRELA